MPIYYFIILSINSFLNSYARLNYNFCAAISIGNKCISILHGFNQLIMCMFLLLSGDIVPHPRHKLLTMSAFAYGYQNSSLVNRNSFSFCISWMRILLLLSGNVELNPGPKVSKKKVSSRGFISDVRKSASKTSSRDQKKDVQTDALIKSIT